MENKRSDSNKDDMIELLGQLYQEHRESDSAHEEFELRQAFKRNGISVGMWYYNQKRNKFCGLAEVQKD